jgi:hypothetical protein
MAPETKSEPPSIVVSVTFDSEEHSTPAPSPFAEARNSFHPSRTTATELSVIESGFGASTVTLARTIVNRLLVMEISCVVELSKIVSFAIPSFGDHCDPVHFRKAPSAISTGPRSIWHVTSTIVTNRPPSALHKQPPTTDCPGVLN